MLKIYFIVESLTFGDHGFTVAVKGLKCIAGPKHLYPAMAEDYMIW